MNKFKFDYENHYYEQMFSLAEQVGEILHKNKILFLKDLTMNAIGYSIEKIDIASEDKDMEAFEYYSKKLGDIESFFRKIISDFS